MIKKTAFIILLMAILFVMATLNCPSPDEIDNLLKSSSSYSSSSSSTVSYSSTPGTVNYTYTGLNDEIYLATPTPSNATNLSVTLNLGSSTKDVYFIFTNTNTVTDIVSPTVANIIANIELPVNNVLSLNNEKRNAISEKIMIYDKPEIRKFNENAGKYLIKSETKSGYNALTAEAPNFDIAGNTNSFMYESTTAGLIPATCRKIVTNGTKTLNVWVANDCWITGKAYNVTQAMVDQLADKFMITGANNDIYDWITNIFGAEWGTHSFSNMISPNNEITILLYDIDNNNADFITAGGVVGFYYSKDNFKTSYYNYSNQRIMFYIDAVMFSHYSAGEGSWSIANNWPSIVISTLAHEFQHMIHFYQKNILRNGSSQTWINEMCSMAAEDLVADKLGVNGPRGIAYNISDDLNTANTNGRLPLYNYFNDDSVNVWQTGNNVLRSYSINYAFGAYLSRNFGGSNLFKNIVQNTYGDTQAIDSALSTSGYSETFATSLRKWGAANLVSDNASPPAGYFKYNNGSSWMSSVTGSLTYNLGSINLYNRRYLNTSQGIDQTGPYIYSTSPVGGTFSDILAASNRYYLYGTSQTGTKNISVNIQSPDVKLTIVIK